uniref:Replication protein A subunit n=1 Tax=Lygus hesperus TaxID=30085 RepID=A0A0A9YUP1_LYGHE
MDQLTAGAIKTIMTGGEVLNPIVQILGSKIIPGHGVERYRLLISDGVHLNSFAMLATQLTPMLTRGELVDYTIIKITNHVITVVKNAEKGDKRVMVVLGVEVIMHGAEVGHKIGDPTNFTDAMQNAEPSPPSTPARPPAPTSSHQNGNVTRRSIDNTHLNTPSASGKTHPIMSLSPYQNSWVIKARVMSKSNIRTWSNAKGEGKLFSVDLVDESGEIRATGFRDAVDRFYELLQENKVYLISRCQLKMANKKFSTLKNDYEMTFGDDTRIVPCEEDDSSIPTIQYNFVKLDSLQDAQAGQMLDFVGVCKSAGDIINLTSKTTNRELKKRDLSIVDQTQAAVTLTLWGSQAEEFNADGNPIIAVKGGKVNEFNGGKSVGLVGGSVFNINPDIPEAHRLRGWYDGLSADTKFTSISASIEGGSSGKWCTLAEAIEEKLGYGDKPDYFSTYVNVMHVKTEKCVYKACPTPDCNKKVIDQNTGQYRCEKCNKEFDSYKFRMMLSMNVGDFSGNQWVTLFHDAAEDMLGVSGDEVGRWQENESPEFGEVFKKVTLRPYNMKLRAKVENYGDESRLKMTVMNAKVPDFKDRCRRLITEIRQLSGISA